MLFRVAVVEGLPVYHHSEGDIFFLSLCKINTFFGTIGPILSQFEKRVPPKPMLGAWTVLHHYIIAHKVDSK